MHCVRLVWTGFANLRKPDFRTLPQFRMENKNATLKMRVAFLLYFSLRLNYLLQLGQLGFAHAFAGAHGLQE
jgi:hypothetical protein